MSERTLLAQMLWDLKEAGDRLSLKKMVARSHGLLSVSTLHAVMNGNVKELTPDTIAGLANILNVSEAQVLAALKNKPLNDLERVSEEKRKLCELYDDIPRQCQQDVLDLMTVLQRNHSLSARQARRQAVVLPERVAPAAAVIREGMQIAELPYRDADVLPGDLIPQREGGEQKKKVG